MGGKTSTSTSQVKIPSEVLARYNAVNQYAEQVAGQPFQQYATDPNAFVAPLTPTQQAGIQNVNMTQGMYSPYYQGATQSLLAAGQSAMPSYEAAAQNVAGGLAGAQPYQELATGYGIAGARAVAPGELGGAQIQQYMSPYLQNVVGSTMANLRQQQQQEQSALLGQQIGAGAFGGERGRLARANLARQQGLASGQVLSDLLNQGYGQALGTAQQQQQLGLGAEQANRAAQAAAAQQMAAIGQQGFGQQLAAAQQQQALGQGLYGIGAGVSQGLAALGTGAQQAGLTGAQAQLQAGAAQQQTQQAALSALYNQYLQQQGYPFQVAQFLGNIAMGTGALSGSGTTQTQPSSFFSDERLKDNIQPIGETYDGQKIVKFNYKGSPSKQIGLVAQDVETKHPEAVGLAGGYKTVDYDAATQDAASMGGGVLPHHEGQGFARGGSADDDALARIEKLLAAPSEIVPYGAYGLYGQGDANTGPYKTTLIEISRRGSPVSPTKIDVKPLNWAGNLPAGIEQYARGGGVAGYADGGSPDYLTQMSQMYSNAPWAKGGSLNIPHDIKQYELVRPEKLSGESSSEQTMRDMTNAMSAGENIAKIYSGVKKVPGFYDKAASFFGGAANGGRIGYADGGLPGMANFGELTPEERANYERAAATYYGGVVAPAAMDFGAEMQGPSLNPSPTAARIAADAAAQDAANYENISRSPMVPYLSKYGWSPTRAAEAEAAETERDRQKSAAETYARLEQADKDRQAATAAEYARLVQAERGQQPRDILNIGGLRIYKTPPQQPQPTNVITSMGGVTVSESPQRQREREQARRAAQIAQFRADDLRNLGGAGEEVVLPAGGLAAPGETYGPALPPDQQAPAGVVVPPATTPAPTAPLLTDAAGASSAGVAGVADDAGRAGVAGGAGASGAGVAGVADDAGRAGVAGGAGASGAGVAGGAGAGGAGAGGAGGAPGWMARNEQWLVPLLSGLGTMAASPSRYAGSAFLQGLGGAAGAYETMRTKMAEREQTGEAARQLRIDADRVEQQIAQNSLYATAPGYYLTTVWNTGVPQQVTLSVDDIRSGKYLFTPESFRASKAAGIAPAAAPAAALQGGKTANAQILSRANQLGLTPMMNALQEAINIQSQFPAGPDERDPKIMADTISQADASRGLVMQFNELAQQLEKAPKGDWATTAAGFVGNVNGLLNTLGVPVEVLKDMQSAKTAGEYAQKLRNSIGSLSGTAGKSVEHLATVMGQLPSPTATREAKAEGMASVMVNNMRTIDSADAYNFMRDYAQQVGGLGRNQLPGFGRDLPSQFSKIEEPRLRQEQAILGTLGKFDLSPGVSALSYLIDLGRAQNISDAQINQIAVVAKRTLGVKDEEATRIAKDMVRYFQPKI
jgi:hypothetical protein